MEEGGGTPALHAGLGPAWRLESGQWSQVLLTWRAGDNPDAAAAAPAADAHSPVAEQSPPPPWPPGVEAAEQREWVELKTERVGDTSAPEVTLKLTSAPAPPAPEPAAWEVGRGVWVVSTARVVEAYVASPPPSPAFGGGSHQVGSSWRYAGSGKGVEGPAEAAGEPQNGHYWAWVGIPPQRVPCTELKLKGLVRLGAIVVEVRPRRADGGAGRRADEIIDMAEVAHLVSGIHGYQPPPGLPPPSALASLPVSQLFQALAAPSATPQPSSSSSSAPPPSFSLASLLAGMGKGLQPQAVAPAQPSRAAPPPQPAMSVDGSPTMEGGMAMVGVMKAYVDSALEQMERRLVRRVDDMEGLLNARLDALLAAVSSCNPRAAAAATTNHERKLSGDSLSTIVLTHDPEADGDAAFGDGGGGSRRYSAHIGSDVIGTEEGDETFAFSDSD